MLENGEAGDCRDEFEAACAWHMLPFSFIERSLTHSGGLSKAAVTIDDLELPRTPFPKFVRDVEKTE